MSRIGKQPIPLTKDVTVTVEKTMVKVKGPKGELSITLHPRMTVVHENSTLLVTRASDEKLDKSLHGLTRALLANMVEGVSKGFSKQLEIQGVGFRASMSGKKLVMALGFSHPVEFTPPAGITIAIEGEKKNILNISGIDKQQVGEVSAVVRGLRKPDPYKGKGIRYVGEKIVLKAGKAAATAAGGAK